MQAERMSPHYEDGLWDEHGEALPNPVFLDEIEEEIEDQPDFNLDINDMFTAFANNSPPGSPYFGDDGAAMNTVPPDVQRFYSLINEANVDLYPGSTKMKKLEYLVRLYQIKCLGGISDKALSLLLELTKLILPDGETLPYSFYQAKKLIRDLGLSYQKIDACPNDCMIYWKDTANLSKCHTCGTSRYLYETIEDGVTRRKISAKVLRYFPVTPRLQRLFMSRCTSNHMTWHATDRPKDGRMRHPADSPAWKELDRYVYGMHNQRSIVNKHSRAKRRMIHTTGTKTFAQIRNKYKNENGGVNPDRCKMFELTHVHDFERPEEPNSKRAIELMNDKIDKIKATKRASQLPEVLNDFEINEVYASVLGKETRGRVRGFGIGVRPDQVPGVQVQKRGIHLEVQGIREQHEAEIEMIRKQSQAKEDRLMEEMNKQTLATTDKLKNMEIAMKKQGALLALLLGAYDQSSDVIAAAIRMKGGSLQPSMSHSLPSCERNIHDLDDVYIPQCCEELHQQVATN